MKTFPGLTKIPNIILTFTVIERGRVLPENGMFDYSYTCFAILSKTGFSTTLCRLFLENLIYYAFASKLILLEDIYKLRHLRKADASHKWVKYEVFVEMHKRFYPGQSV